MRLSPYSLLKTKKVCVLKMAIRNVSAYDVTQVQQLNRPRGKGKSGKLGKATSPISYEPKQDTFEKSAYDRVGFTNELESIKDKNGKSVYNTQHIMQILKNVDREPARLEPLRDMAHLSNMKGKDLARISYGKADSLAVVNEFSKKTKENGNPKYASSHLIKFSTLPVTDLERIRPLTETTIAPNEMIKIAQNI